MIICPVHEYNHEHEPGGSSKGGQFAPKGTMVGRDAKLLAAARAAVDANERAQAGILDDNPIQLTDAEKVALDSMLKEAFSRPDVRIEVHAPHEILNRILADGRLMNQFESRQSRGYIDESAIDKADYPRRGVEETVMGVPRDLPAAMRPIYGAVSGIQTGPGSSLSTYGDVIFELKPELAARTTATFGDSFGFDGESGKGSLSGMAEPVQQPSWRMLNLRDRKETADRLASLDKLAVAQAKYGLDKVRRTDALPHWFGYVEAQISGGVSLRDDVAKIKITGGAAPRLAANLEKHGWVLAKGSRQHGDDTDDAYEIWVPEVKP